MMAVPSIPTLRERILADLQARIDTTTPWLPVSLLSILAWILAGIAYGLHVAIATYARLSLPDSDDPEVIGWWAEVLALPRVPASVASGAVTFTGEDAAVVPAATLLVGTSGSQFALDADVEIVAGSGAGTVTAVEPGLAGNQAAGTTLTLLAPVAGVNSSVAVAAGGLAGGADIESESAWSARIVDRLRTPPQGGSLADYARWTKEAHPTVTDVWPVSNGYGAGTVVVRFMTYGATANGIPPPQVVDAVYAYIDARRPAGMQGLFVLAPVAKPLDVTFSSLTPNTQAVRDAVLAELQALVRRAAQPGAALPLSQIDEAVSLAAGETDHVIAVPALTPTCEPGEIFVLGTVTWP